VTKYYRVATLLHEDEYQFVKRVSELMQCSLAKAVSICVVWARQNQNFRNLLKTLEEAQRKESEREWHGS
jgi:predicted PolB exonuclease-like 3'-5' exonuclease